LKSDNQNALSRKNHLNLIQDLRAVIRVAGTPNAINTKGCYKIGKIWVNRVNIVVTRHGLKKKMLKIALRIASF